MARFDVYSYNTKAVPYVLDVQADLLKDLNTVVVLPLVPVEQAAQEAVPRLKPIVQINGKDHILMTTDIGTISKKSLGSHITNIEKDYRQDVTEALDFLFQGF